MRSGDEHGHQYKRPMSTVDTVTSGFDMMLRAYI